MDKMISASEANRRFSALLRAVRKGRRFVVTAHGQPVARLIPVDEHSDLDAAAKTALLARLQKQSVANVGPWSRDDLYEDTL